jgi:hypothetical protein
MRRRGSITRTVRLLVSSLTASAWRASSSAGARSWSNALAAGLGGRACSVSAKSVTTARSSTLVTEVGAALDPQDADEVGDAVLLVAVGAPRRLLQQADVVVVPHRTHSGAGEIGELAESPGHGCSLQVSSTDVSSAQMSSAWSGVREPAPAIGLRQPAPPAVQLPVGQGVDGDPLALLP